MKRVISLFLSVIIVMLCLESGFTALASDSEIYVPDNSLMNSEQTDIIEQTITKWNNIFIKQNKSISSCNEKSRKEYLTVKTIYDFIVRNTVYDTLEYENYFNNRSTGGYAHSAYAAFYGNIDGARNADSSDEAIALYDWSTISNGDIISIQNTNQGKAVCDGYAGLFYMLCVSNGIECTMVEGTKQTYVESLGKEVNDPHAWNYVKLSGKWYQVDTTYSASASIKDFNYINYYYFLGGSKNAYFTDKMDHQNVFSVDPNTGKVCNYPVLCDDDFNYATGGVSFRGYNEDNNNFIAIVVKSASGLTSYNACRLISDNGDVYRYECDKNGAPVTDAYGNRKVVACVTEEDKGISYPGMDKIVYMIIPGYIYGEEYTVDCNDSTPTEPGRHIITASDYYGNRISRSYTINRIDMAQSRNNISSNSSGNINYSGQPVNIDITIYDGYNRLIPQSEFICYYSGNNSVGTAAPTDPGDYSISLDFSASKRYCGIIQGPSFKINKADLSKLTVGNQEYYSNGTDQMQQRMQFSYGGKTFYPGVDFDVQYSGCNPITASSGTYKLVAKSSSKYLTGSTASAYLKVYKSILDNDVSFSYSNVTPNSADVQLVANNTVLREGVDYTKTVVSSSSNITLTVCGIGLYSGKRVVNFMSNTPAPVYTPVTSVAAQPTVTAPPPVQNIQIIIPTPKKTKITSLKAGKKSFTIKWKKISNISGYQIQYSTSKKFTKKTTKTVKITKTSTGKKTISKLKKGKKYYVRVRAYGIYSVNGKKTTKYASWSSVKSVKAK